MEDDKEESFRNMTLKDKMLTIVGITLLIIFVIGVIFGFYFFGMAGIFELLGIYYESIWSLVVFVVSFFLLGLMIEIIFKAIYSLAVEKIAGKVKRLFTRLVMEVFANWLVLFTVDEVMRSITISFTSEILVAFLIAIFEFIFEEKKDVNHTKGI